MTDLKKCSNNKQQEEATSIAEAVKTVRNFVTETTGQEPTDAEIARALKRYFVLKEIMEHIEMERGEGGAG